MKTTLSFDRNARQYKCDVGKPANRFYLGSVALAAQERKTALIRFWQFLQLNGKTEWEPSTLAIAHKIRKGEPVKMPQLPGEDEHEYGKRLESIANLTGDTAQIQGTITSEDFDRADRILMKDRIAELEKLVREKLGGGVLIGSSVTIHKALDEWHEYRMTTELSPDTGETTEHVRTEKNVIELVKRQVADLPLSALTYLELEKWCSIIANRPISKKTGNPIKPATARNGLKLIRQWVKWAGRKYGWQRPDDWLEATKKTKIKRTTIERREAATGMEKFFTLDELGILWQFAKPMEQLLILCGLNFGFAQAEILNVHESDLANGVLRAFRGKSEVFGRWAIWNETRELAATQLESIPKRRQHIANRWNRLIDRVQKDHPDFAFRSFKWLRKTGSTMIRKIADGETASLYLSHGDVTSDDLLEIYAVKNWEKLDAALAQLREKLLPYMTAAAVTAKLYIPRGKVADIIRGWEQNEKPEVIAEKVGVSRATVYRYRPTQTA